MNSFPTRWLIAIVLPFRRPFASKRVSLTKLFLFPSLSIFLSPFFFLFHIQLPASAFSLARSNSSKKKNRFQEYSSSTLLLFFTFFVLMVRKNIPFRLFTFFLSPCLSPSLLISVIFLALATSSPSSHLHLPVLAQHSFNTLT